MVFYFLTEESVMLDFRAYNQVVKQLRHFFQEKCGFIEVPAQSRLSILAACEDPKTVTPFIFSGVDYPLPQTGQMWLEHDLLKNPDLPGFFCVTTSYRNEPHPIPGRHDKIFPMFEFEAKGGLDSLRNLEADLLSFLGFPKPAYCSYEAMCEKYSVNTLEAVHEALMQQEYGNVISLELFPKRSQPFWNMKQITDNLYNKIDVLLYGMETIGSAERSTDPEQMRRNFFSISQGDYAELLCKAFGKERVLEELDEYLSLPMIPRFGAGIGVTRLVRAMKLAGLIEEQRAFEAIAA